MDRPSRMMKKAIEVALGNRAFPFGAILVNRSNDHVVAEGINRTDENPTWHGEIDVINRYASSCSDATWGDLDLYTTAEPCPMCQAAILWAGFPRVFWGTSISTLIDMGWNQIDIHAVELSSRTPFTECEVIGGILEADCDQLFRDAKQHRPE